MEERFMYLYELQMPLRQRHRTLKMTAQEIILSCNPKILDCFYRTDVAFRSAVDDYVEDKLVSKQHTLKKIVNKTFSISNHSLLFDIFIYLYLNANYSGTIALMDLHSA